MLTVKQIRDIVEPIGKKHGIRRIYLFGSYARGDATENSDVDILIEPGANTVGYFELNRIYNDLNAVLPNGLDMITTGSRNKNFLERIKNEQVLLYAA